MTNDLYSADFDIDLNFLDTLEFTQTSENQQCIKPVEIAAQSLSKTGVVDPLCELLLNTCHGRNNGKNILDSPGWEAFRQKNPSDERISSLYHSLNVDDHKWVSLKAPKLCCIVTKHVSRNQVILMDETKSTNGYLCSSIEKKHLSPNMALCINHCNFLYFDDDNCGIVITDDNIIDSLLIEDVD